MHPALMVECDSGMAISQERAGWRSASTMPGALSVMMDGTMQMLQWSAGNWATTQLVGEHNSVCAVGVRAYCAQHFNDCAMLYWS